MKWRVMLELVGPEGTIGIHEVGGRAAVAEYAPQMIGMTLAEGKRVLAALQVHLVQAQAEDHCRRRRRCQRCGAQRVDPDRAIAGQYRFGRAAVALVGDQLRSVRARRVEGRASVVS